MKKAFSITVANVLNVLSSNTPILAGNITNNRLKRAAKDSFDKLDLDKIENMALCGDDLSEQTDFANDEISVQLVLLGIMSTKNPVGAAL